MTGVLIRRGKNHVKTKTQREHHATTEVEIGLMQLQAKGPGFFCCCIKKKTAHKSNGGKEKEQYITDNSAVLVNSTNN